MRVEQISETMIVLRDANLMGGGFLNFEGRPSQFNPKGGDRTCSFALTEEEAEYFSQLGVRVKTYQNGDSETHFITAKVNFHMYRGEVSPVIILHNNGVATRFDEDNAKELDNIRGVSVDASINIRPYDYAGRQGISVYLNSMHLTVIDDVDPLSKYYNNAPDDITGEAMPFN